jgi:hypothetical protein
MGQWDDDRGNAIVHLYRGPSAGPGEVDYSSGDRRADFVVR